MAAGQGELCADTQLRRAVQHVVPAGPLVRHRDQHLAEQPAHRRDHVAVGQLHVPRHVAQQDRDEPAELPERERVPHGARLA